MAGRSQRIEIELVGHPWQEAYGRQSTSREKKKVRSEISRVLFSSLATERVFNERD
jgi:hypothetical protein